MGCQLVLAIEKLVQ